MKMVIWNSHDLENSGNAPAKMLRMNRLAARQLAESIRYVSTRYDNALWKTEKNPRPRQADPMQNPIQ